MRAFLLWEIDLINKEGSSPLFWYAIIVLHTLILDQAVVQKYYTHKKAYNSVEISEIYSHHLFEIPNFQRKKISKIFFSWKDSEQSEWIQLF